MCQKALDLERSDGGERAEIKCRKAKDHNLWYGAGSPAEFRLVPMCCLPLEWVATASSAKAVSTGCIRSAVGSSAGQRTLISGVHGAREQHSP